MKTKTQAFDMKSVPHLEKILWFSRFSLFVVFFWFGFLKIIHTSPAESLITHLHHQTIANWVSISFFVPFLGFIECAIGILWLFPKLTRLAFALFCLQMLTTFLPLIYLPADTWQDSFTLTLTGQYIVKNLVLIATALILYVFHIAAYPQTSQQNAKPSFWQLPLMSIRKLTM